MKKLKFYLITLFIIMLTCIFTNTIILSLIYGNIKVPNEYIKYVLLFTELITLNILIFIMYENKRRTI